MKKLNKLFYLKAIGQSWTPLATTVWANYAMLGSLDFTKNDIVTALALYAPTISIALVGSVMGHLSYGKKILGSAIKAERKSSEKAVKKLEKQMVLHIMALYKRARESYSSFDWSAIKVAINHKTAGNADWNDVFKGGLRDYRNPGELANYLHPIIKKYIIGGIRNERT